MRVWLAFRVFFAILFQSQFAQQVRRLIDQTSVAGQSSSATPADSPQAVQNARVPPKPASSRHEAVTLLATLQREARLIDIVMEPLGEYSDAQIGAAARDVLRDCGEVLERQFALQPMVAADEGSEIETPADLDPGCYRLTGNVTGSPPYRGRLVHHGWQAARCELPQWSGSAQSALVVAPAELELT